MSPSEYPTSRPDPYDAATLTALAWRRTALRIGGGSIAVAQLLVLIYGAWAYALGLVGVAVALLIHLSASRRFVAVARGTREGDHAPALARAHVRVAILSVFAAGVSVACLAWAAYEWWGR